MNLQQFVELLQKRPVDVKPLEWLKLYQFLGGLVPLWLTSEAVRHIQEEIEYQFPAPQLPQDRGSCWIVMAVPDAQNYPLLKPAFLIVLQWRRMDQPDNRLPGGLRSLADRVRTDLAIAFSHNEYLHWNLYLHPHFATTDQTPDFSGLDKRLSFESGWLALAGGLYLAVNDGQPDEHVWVSARWDRENGIQRVGHLPEKLALAREYGVRQFFLPSEHQNEVPAEYSDMVRPLVQGNNKLRVVLDAYLSTLDVRPACFASDEASFQRCANWYMRQPLEHLEYYCQYLLPYIAKRLRAELLKEHPDLNPEVLVTVASPSWNLVPLVVRFLGVRRCVVLHTQEMSSLLEKIKTALQDSGAPVELCSFRFQESTEAEDLRSLTVWNEYPPDKIAVDFTPGKKKMALDLYRAAPVGIWCLYIDTKQKERRPIPGTEKIMCWRRE